MTVAYRDIDVLTAARRRIRFVFDHFANVVVSISGGKDSTCLWHLAVAEAERRGRRVAAFFLDQEAEYASTIEVIERQMSHPAVDPMWYQVPLQMTNATSHEEVFLNAWWEGEEWMREKHPLAIHHIDRDYPRRFYKFFPWHERQFTEPTAFLVGLRSKESLNRFRAVSSRAGFGGMAWSSPTGGESHRFYPLYDWTFGDVWKYIVDHGIPYNRLYDRLFARDGLNKSTMRVSTPIHEKSFRSLANLQEFEPETYDRLVRRLAGVHAAALYAEDEHVYRPTTLPGAFASWREYRDYLLATTPGPMRERYVERFARQPDDEPTCRHQCRQILINDWENNVPVTRTKASALRERWWDRL